MFSIKNTLNIYIYIYDFHAHPQKVSLQTQVLVKLPPKISRHP
jgi:hypothetical protein